MGRGATAGKPRLCWGGGGAIVTGEVPAKYHRIDATCVIVVVVVPVVIPSVLVT